MQAIRKTKQRGGFTLVELLVVIAIIGVLVALLWTALSLAISSITSRKAFASAAIIVTLLASGILSGRPEPGELRQAVCT